MSACVRVVRAVRAFVCMRCDGSIDEDNAMITPHKLADKKKKSQAQRPRKSGRRHARDQTRRSNMGFALVTCILEGKKGKTDF